VKQSFIPFYEHVRAHYLVPVRDSFLIPVQEKFILPIWVCLVYIWRIILTPWHKMRPATQPGPDPEKRSSSAGSSTAPLSPTESNSSSSTERSVTDYLSVYSANWILRITSLITTVVACLLPTVAIVILARVQSMGLILGCIAIFTALFAVGLVLLSSSSSRVDIFTATAAFSAVMVVFVQNKIQGQ